MQEPERCKNNSCNKWLYRAVAFWPFCGVAMRDAIQPAPAVTEPAPEVAVPQALPIEVAPTKKKRIAKKGTTERQTEETPVREQGLALKKDLVPVRPSAASTPTQVNQGFVGDLRRLEIEEKIRAQKNKLNLSKVLKYCLIGVAGFFGLWLSVAILKFFLWNHFGHVFMTMLFAILAASGLAEDKKFGFWHFVASAGFLLAAGNLIGETWAAFSAWYDDPYFWAVFTRW